MNIIVLVISFLFDFLTKRLAISQGWPVLYNNVFTFSIPAPEWLVESVIVLIFLVILWVWNKEIRLKKKTSLLFAAIIGAGASNLYDRLFERGVIDWIHIYTSHFNIADLTIFVAVLIYLYILYKDKKV